MDLTFGNLFFCPHLFLRIQMPVILSFFITRDYTLDVRRTPIQTNSDVTCSRSCDQGKISKKDRKIVKVEKNPFF